MQIFQLCYSDIFVVQRDFFFIYNIIKHHIKAFSNEQQVRKNFQVFDQNEGYMGYPLKKCKNFDYLILTISQSKKLWLFDQTLGNLSPWENANFWAILEWHFCSPERLLFYLQHHQTSYQGLFEWATSSEEFSIFWPKWGVYGLNPPPPPQKKTQTFRLSHSNNFVV